uniref:Uncharacterized protein n=1 Tax=viral metagenome TaxID=1070528 RepID=A0A6M3LSF7_9ZZZZ
MTKDDNSGYRVGSLFMSFLTILVIICIAVVGFVAHAAFNAVPQGTLQTALAQLETRRDTSREELRRELTAEIDQLGERVEHIHLLTAAMYLKQGGDPENLQPGVRRELLLWGKK